MAKFSELTGMKITDMGELDIKRAEEVAAEIEALLGTEELLAAAELRTAEASEENKTKWVCSVCKYVHYGPTPPEKCPLCGVPASMFVKEE